MSLDFLGRAPSWFAVIVALAGGCVSEIGDDRDRTEAADDPLIGGVVDYGQPEVGYLTGSGCGVAGCLRGCTATLVSTNVVLSAAHCVDFLTLGALPSGQYGQFVLESAERVPRGVYSVVEYRSFGREVGRDDDIALLRLREAVPATVAVPARLAPSYPAGGTAVTMWGYGCTDRGSEAGGGIKRRHTYRFDDRPDRLCPGDSGGPHIEAGGSIIRVNSGWESRIFGLWHADLYGQVPPHYGRLQPQVDAWAPASCAPDSARPRLTIEVHGRHATTDALSTEAPACRWDARADVPWIGLSPSSGVGPALVNVSIEENFDPAARLGHVLLGGSSLPLLQAGSVPPFDDVTPSFVEPYIDLIKQWGITRGCSASPPLYCPRDTVTRGQMATFIVRGLLGDGFGYDPTPYFDDVPPDHIFFRYVQKMRELGITVGCSTSPPLFCVDDNTTRGQMAAFLVRALEGEGFAHDGTPVFADVSTDHVFFRHIQRLFELGIATRWDPTYGCTYGSYCPDFPMRRDLMAVWLGRAFLGAP